MRDVLKRATRLLATHASLMSQIIASRRQALQKVIPLKGVVCAGGQQQATASIEVINLLEG
jgi:hypothetical protein